MRQELIQIIEDKLPSLARVQYDNDKYAHFVYDESTWEYDSDTGIIEYNYTIRELNGLDVCALNFDELKIKVKELEAMEMLFIISYQSLMASLLDEA